jgi:precorrin-6A/cobalt-precorrin-6A reductase
LSVVSSLAGRVRDPALPAGEVRIGGFGGIDGLAGYLGNGVDAVLDATHPFAATISRHAAVAARHTGVALLALRRPGWTAGDGDWWTRVADIETAAAAAAARPAGTVLLTTGRRDLAAFAGDDTHHYVVRTVEPADPPAPPRITSILDRGPYTVDGETALMTEHDVSLLVTKDSGGTMTTAKLTAARQRSLEVIMVDRPVPPADVETVETVDAAIAWLKAISRGSDGG